MELKLSSNIFSGYYIAGQVCFGSTVSGCLSPTSSSLVSLQERCKYNNHSLKSGTTLPPSDVTGIKTANVQHNPVEEECYKRSSE